MCQADADILGCVSGRHDGSSSTQGAAGNAPEQVGVMAPPTTPVSASADDTSVVIPSFGVSGCMHIKTSKGILLAASGTVYMP